jgi:trimeric autotransporter adhesin
MRRSATGVLVMSMVVACASATRAQAPAPAVSQQQSAAPAQSVGGRLHGVAKSGNVPLPGVTVTAQNTLTGKRYSTTTDITGAWSLTIPQNGRYVIRTQFAAFATGSEEALLNASNHEQTVNFDLMLASRAAAQQQAQQGSQGGTESQGAQAIRQMIGSGAQSLSLMSSMAADTETQAGLSSAGGSGAALPSAASNTDFSSDSVAITGQSGQVSPLAGVDIDRLRDAMETIRQQGGLAGGQGGGLFGGGGGFGGGGFGGGFGGAGGGFGGGGGRRGNFRGFNPGQPHGAIYWTGSNSALNAEPFSLEGQDQNQPPSGSNKFGLTFISSPYIPHLTKPSGKDTMFLTVAGTRSSTPSDEYGNIPTAAERAGDFSALGLAPIYDPTTGLQFASNGVPNIIPASRISPQAAALLNYFPQPNLTSGTQNYHLLTTAQSNSNQIGARYLRSLGANATQPGGGRGGGGGGRRNQNQGLRQSVSFNYNFSNSALDNVNLFPELGGKSRTSSNSLQAGYTVGYHKLTNIFNANWNRSNTQATNFFTGLADVSTQNGILGQDGAALNSSPLNYGLPDVTLSNLTGLSEQQPSFSLAQTISFTETLSWIHGKHNLRFGGDYRRVHRDFLGGSNSTGSFTFTGLFTEAPGTASSSSSSPASGSALADFLLGLPQSTTIDSSIAKSYLRDNVYDAYALDDWRVLPSLTLNYGLRYEFFAPYMEKYGHLADVDTNPDGGFTSIAQVEAGGSSPVYGQLPSSLVFPFRVAFAPRIGLALRLPKQTVLRAGFGMNYSVGEYASFATTMAHQPPFANEQTNEVALSATGTGAPPCAQTIPVSCFTLAQGFPAPDQIGSYALNPHYSMPYVEAWNIDVQKTLPWGVVMNIGYNGSKGNHQDITSAPRATPANPLTNPTNQVFTYDQNFAFSKLSAGTVRMNKRLSKGMAVGANYQFSHSIDDSSAVGGPSSLGGQSSGTQGGGSQIAQNWQNLNAEESSSTFDERHQVSGTYVYELPFGKDKFWVTSGTGSHILEGFSVSGSFSFASGTPLNPTYAASAANVACGTSGSGRPDLVPGVSVTSGGGSQGRWFNPAAFTEPAAVASYPCAVFGTAARNSITGPGTIKNNMSLSKTVQMGDTRSMEIRATAMNAFNTVQYSGVGTSVTLPTFGEVTSAGAMRSFTFLARFRF